MTLYIMALGLFAILFISYTIFKKDIMSPSFLLCIGYFISCLSAIYNIQSWNVEVGLYTDFIYFLGILSFIAGEIFVERISSRNVKRLECRQAAVFSEIKIGSIKYLFCVLVCVIILILTYREVVRIANLNFADWGNLLYNYKRNVIDSGLDDSNMSNMVVQLNKVTKGFAFVFLFIFINNMFALKDSTIRRKISNAKYLVPPVIYILQCTVKGGRFNSVALIIGAVFLFYFLWRLKVGWSKEIKFKYILNVILVIIGVFAIFWLSRELVGRMSSDTSAIGYLTRYLGGGPALFDKYLNDPIYLHDGVHETFAGLLQSFDKLGFIDVTVRTSHEFRTASTGIIIGNAYSALRNYYHDFGIFGVMIMNFLLSVIFSGVYYRMKNTITSPNKNRFTMILYSSMIYIVIFQFFTDYLFSHISIGFFTEIFVLFACYYFVLKIKMGNLKIKIIKG